jgi:hypothetical protein
VSVPFHDAERDVCPDCSRKMRYDEFGYRRMMPHQELLRYLRVIV